MENITYCVEKMPALNYGDRFYMVQHNPAGKSCVGYESWFEARCPACGGRRKITGIGADRKTYECDCPICASRNNHWGNTIRLRQWTVAEYIVHEITLSGPEYRSKYGKTSFPPMHAGARGFAIYGRDTVRTYTGHKTIDADPAAIELGESNNIDQYIFTSRKDAEVLLGRLQDHDRRLLEEFNEKYGTNHEYPYGAKAR